MDILMRKKESFEKPLCIRCEEPLNLVRKDDDTNEMEFLCPHCGTIELFYPCADEDRKNYAFYNEAVKDTLGSCSHGYDGFCPQCGSHIIWSGDFMRSETLGDVDDEDDDSLSSNVICPHCGASIDVIDVKPSEMKNYPAFADKNNDQ